MKDPVPVYSGGTISAGTPGYPGPLRLDQGRDRSIWPATYHDPRCGSLVHVDTNYGYDFAKDQVTTVKRYRCGRCGHTVDMVEATRTSAELADTRPNTPFDKVAGPEPKVEWLGDWRPKEMPVLQGSVIGYRAWTLVWCRPARRWVDEQPQLAGVWGAWKPGINEAIHYGGGHQAPDPNCRCGFNALARFSDDDAWWTRATTMSGRAIPGAIEAWSEDPRIILPGDAPREIRETLGQSDSESRHFVIDPPGFRVPFARVVLLAIDDSWPTDYKSVVKSLAAEHGADVCKREHLAVAAQEHGQLVSDELLEWAGAGRPSPHSSYVGFGLTFKNFQNAMASFNATAVSMSQALMTAYDSYRRVLGQMPVSLQGPPTWVTSSTTPHTTHKAPKLKLKTPGPPGYGKHRKGDVVQDKFGTLYECVKGGQPASWCQIP